MSISQAELRELFKASDCLHDEQAVSRALDEMAAGINACCSDGDGDWLVMVVMNGGLLPAAWLMERFDFLFELDYLHATRYRGETTGSDLLWRALPQTSLHGRNILLIDDILDEGITLQKIIEHCEAQGAATIKSAVLVRKQHDRNAGVQADFVGLEVPDRYVFGCGMDYREHFRHLCEIRALPNN
jgi:hypoxanthine phosphoribosyltransferase